MLAPLAPVLPAPFGPLRPKSPPSAKTVPEVLNQLEAPCVPLFAPAAPPLLLVPTVTV
jgi:hypothetical protein